MKRLKQILTTWECPYFVGIFSLGLCLIWLFMILYALLTNPVAHVFVVVIGVFVIVFVPGQCLYKIYKNE